ncbi:MAG TPA: hypothetical protein VKI45_09560 [Allosphingosinicella sp.]|nr:hypothetical protein [Allosphingosinicella sp.]
MRPRSISLFEGLSLAAVALGALVMILSWHSVMATVSASVRGAGIEEAVIVLAILYVGLLVLLILLASRRASAVAKWLFTAIIVAELIMSLPKLPGMLGAGPIGWASTVQLVLQLVALWFLFVPASRAWFREWRAA